MKRFQFGFTLVELLVVISIIGGLASLLLVNFIGIRGRAADSSKKNNVTQLKTALRLYYNDFQAYPAGSGTLMGCGAAGTTACTAGGEFSVGDTMYMKELPAVFSYYSDGADEFIILVELENASDEDIETSQGRCDPTSRVFFTGDLGESDFVVCES